MAEKLKLPREVAEAIGILGARWGRKAFLQAGFLRNSQHPEARIINDYFKPFESDDSEGFDKLFFALYNGYEVEETPEDKVREHYKNLLSTDEKDDYSTGKIAGIKFTLDALKKYIEGVNV